MKKSWQYLIIIFICSFISNLLIFIYVNLSLIYQIILMLIIDIIYIDVIYLLVTYVKNKYLHNIIYIILLGNLIILPVIYFINDYSFKNSTNYEFEKYSKYPILGNLSTGSYFDPYVILVNDTYYMYFSNRNEGSISLSKSNDGINWSNPITVLNKSNDYSFDLIVNRASVVYINDKFYMWYTGQNGSESSIGFATSEDGINFTKYSNYPIIEPTLEFEKESIMNPNVIYDVKSNLFKMWYAAGEQYEPDVIGYAESSDGINWIKNSTPVLTKNDDIDSYDYYKVGASDVHILEDGTYLMFYIGYTDINTARILYATSEDGINWKRNKNFIIEGSKLGFDNNATYKPSAIYNKKENKWMLWYNGRLNNREYIGLATCNNYYFYK